MPRLALLGGSYASRSLAASAQVCMNLVPEPLPTNQGEPAPFVYYPTPGLNPFSRHPNGSGLGLNGETRCLYTTTAGELIACIGQEIYLLNYQGQVDTLLGQITSISGQVRMQDNGLVLVIVDGSASGWYAVMSATGSLSGKTLVTIVDPAFYGSATIAVLDTFFLFVKPDGTHWYTSPANYIGNSTPFDATYIASKTAYPDRIVGITVIGQAIWIIGEITSEIWFDSGGALFPFQRDSSLTPDQGCQAVYSIPAQITDGTVFWLGRDRAGVARVYMGAENSSQPVSNFAVENALLEYSKGYPLNDPAYTTRSLLGDAVGHVYQQGGHTFYVLTLPAADVTWVYDMSTQEWHQRCWLGSDGLQHRIRCNAFAAAYGSVLAGDIFTGAIYSLDQDLQTDMDAFVQPCPIVRQRSFQHVAVDGKRMRHNALMLDMQAGQNINVTVDWSDDRGATYGQAVTVNTGTVGGTYPTLYRLGIARDRVYRFTWTDPGMTALMGAFIDVVPLRT